MPLGLGAWVRVAERPVLEAAVRDPDPSSRPQPRQILAAGRPARVVAVRLDRGEPRYALEAQPGLWRPGWLRPLDPASDGTGSRRSEER